jgi:hypothetical protein
LIIEIKKFPTPTEKADDIKKIKAFIVEYPYYYQFGAFISFDEYPVEWFNQDEL